MFKPEQKSLVGNCWRGIFLFQVLVPFCVWGNMLYWGCKNFFQKMATEKFEERPWGSYETFDDDSEDKYWVKKLIVKPGQSLSLQKHAFRNEFWVCVRGELNVEKNGEKLVLAEGDTVKIKIGDTHRASNETAEDTIFIEVATGKCLEVDNQRLEDRYGRAEDVK